MAQTVEHLPFNHEVLCSILACDKFFSHVCAHFGILGRCGIILSQFGLRRQLQYRTALGLSIKVKVLVQMQTCSLLPQAAITSTHSKLYDPQ